MSYAYHDEGRSSIHCILLLLLPLLPLPLLPLLCTHHDIGLLGPYYTTRTTDPTPSYRLPPGKGEGGEGEMIVVAVVVVVIVVVVVVVIVVMVVVGEVWYL